MRVRARRPIVRRESLAVPVPQKNGEAEKVFEDIKKLFQPMMNESDVLTLQQLWHLGPKNQNEISGEELERAGKRVELILYYYFAGIVNGEIPNPLQVHEVCNELA